MCFGSHCLLSMYAGYRKQWTKKRDSNICFIHCHEGDVLKDTSFVRWKIHIKGTKDKCSTPEKRKVQLLYFFESIVKINKLSLIFILQNWGYSSGAQSVNESPLPSSAHLLVPLETSICQMAKCSSVTDMTVWA